MSANHGIKSVPLQKENNMSEQFLATQHNINITASEEKGKYSDGYHAFDELYEHRIVIFIALCRICAKHFGTGYDVWCSKAHSDGSVWDGWFILGINKAKGEQITYHLPISKWKDVSFAEELELAPEFDGHTSEDVLKRISEL